jgi:hypothetical protein
MSSERVVGGGCSFYLSYPSSELNLYQSYLLSHFLLPIEILMEVGGIKENDGGGEFNYDIFDILEELL